MPRYRRPPVWLFDRELPPPIERVRTSSFDASNRGATVTETTFGEVFGTEDATPCFLVIDKSGETVLDVYGPDKIGSIRRKSKQVLESVKEAVTDRNLSEWKH